MRRAVLVLLLAGASTLAGELDVERYELAVRVTPDRIEEVVTIHAASPAPRWRLELADTMKVSEVKAGDALRPHVHKNGILEIDAGDATAITVRANGRPLTRFSEKRGGFVRTAVTPEITYVRSQYPWYPRLAGDAASYRVEVEAPDGWLTRSADVDRPLRRIGLVSAPFVRIEGGDGLDALVLPGHEDGARRLIAVAAKARSAYGEWFGDISAHRFTLIEMPEAFGRGSGYGEADYVLIGAGALGTPGWATDLVAHEVSHLWWGNEIGFRHFASESLAEYSTLRFLERERGADAARRMRNRAVGRVVDAKEAVALDEIRDFGARMEPTTYRVHAYEKGMMLLAMSEEVLGRRRMDRLLAALIQEHRGQVIDYPILRAALVKAGARDLEVWDAGPIPELTLDCETKKAGRKWRVKGTLSQAGTSKPWRMPVRLAASQGEEVAETGVKLRGKSARFSLTTPFEPTRLSIDPDYLLLAKRTLPGIGDPDALIDKAFAVVNDPGESDPRRLEATIAQLRELLAAGAGKYEGLCHTGIGRCRHDEAATELNRAIETGGGGPFHRAWAHLRLGCIADLKGDRGTAEKHYRKVLAGGRKGHAATLAQRFFEKPYKGYAKDG